MPRRKTQGGGAHYHRPFQIRGKAHNAVQECLSDVLYAHTTLETYVYDDFIGKSFSTSAGPWGVFTVGTPTAAAIISNASGGQLKLACAATSEAESNILTFGDVRNIENDLPWYFECRLKIAADSAANQTFVWGMTGASASGTLASNAPLVLFKVTGASNALLLDYHDGTTSVAGTATLRTLTAATFYIFSIERAMDGTIYCRTADGDGQNEGHQVTRQVLSPTAGTLLQPFIGVQKASGVTTPEIDLDYVKVIGNRS